MKYINPKLVSLKCVLFLFFGAIGSLLPFLPQHMTAINLSMDECVIISIVSPIIAVLGPLIAAPVADRLAGGFGGAPRSKTGGYLRIMISVSLVLATVFYWLLIIIQPIKRGPSSVLFECNESGGIIYQSRCKSESECFNWGSREGLITVKSCKFSCNSSDFYQSLEPKELTSSQEMDNSTSQSPEYNYSEDYNNIAPTIESEFGAVNYTDTPNDLSNVVPLPHMCYKNNNQTICQVYTEFSRPVQFSIALKSSLDVSEDEDDAETKCKYPFAEYFYCRIPESSSCNLSIFCEIDDPYGDKSLLKISECGYGGYESFWLYLFIKSFADLYLAAAVALLATSVVIATRETSTGRGDVGKQFAAGALGFGLFAAIIGGAAHGKFFEAMVSFTILMILTSIILLADKNLPLSPPEWWWHTRCGLLALPMSSVRKYGCEIAALGIVLLALGIFWNAIDSLLAWRVAQIHGKESLIGFTVTVAAIPAVIFLMFAEKIVDYCGHSNILIFCFVNYIFHHLAITLIEEPDLLLGCEILEIFTLHVMYITAILYLRHLVPRKFTTCGQALPVVTHFCLGRSIGAVLGSIGYKDPKLFKEVHKWFTVVAAITAVIYFIAYHFFLKPQCAAPVHLPPDPAPSVVQSMNGNGSYTPLRVYHNSKSKKGHFRY